MSRPARVLLVRHAPTEATRRHAFPTDEPLDERGRDQARALHGLVVADRVVSAPAVRCRQTAAALASDAITVQVSDRWAELDFGAWAGRTMEQVWADDREALSRWLDDPTVAPTGGEPVTGLVERVVAGLAELREPGATTAVVTSGGPIKIAVLHGLDAPLASLWKLDVAPCSVTTLHSRPDGGWTVRAVNAITPTSVPA